jgi:hypothetical protein
MKVSEEERTLRVFANLQTNPPTGDEQFSTANPETLLQLPLTGLRISS